MFVLPDFESPEYIESLKKSKLTHYERIRPFLMDQWPAQLWSLSFGDNIFIPLPLADIIGIFDGEINDNIKEFIASLDRIMCGKEWFFKNNNRSSKDSECVASTGKEIIEAIAWSERMLDDFVGFDGINKPVFLILRTLIDIPKKYEFRCFVRERNLIGISQYFYPEIFPGLSDEKAEIESKIIDFHKRVNAIFPEPDYIFDVFLNEARETILLEVNPYGLSDPCLFGNYQNLENSGGFLIREEKLQSQRPCQL